jgi:hypothetical protein
MWGNRQEIDVYSSYRESLKESVKSGRLPIKSSVTPYQYSHIFSAAYRQPDYPCCIGELKRHINPGDRLTTGKHGHVCTHVAGFFAILAGMGRIIGAERVALFYTVAHDPNEANHMLAAAEVAGERTIDIVDYRMKPNRVHYHREYKTIAEYLTSLALHQNEYGSRHYTPSPIFWVTPGVEETARIAVTAAVSSFTRDWQPAQDQNDSYFSL